SAVVVGAAIEFLARNGLLPQFKFQMRGKQTENTYFWGVMTESTSTIRDDRLLFHPVDDNTRDEWTEFTTSAQRVILGRKMAPDEDARTSPIYVLKTDPGDRIGPTQLTVRIRRVKADEEAEEHLDLESVTGTVAGQPAILGENVQFRWRTLADERYYLDTGGLDNIEMPR
ncbi:MAG: virulence factor SrfB, partial [Planctomycetia bacterium]|nr:virulence factor SrfB [Planctomycetia bacterium]